MFDLDKKLQQDSFFVCDLELSRLLLMNDANYPWLILVPRINNLVELIDLDFDQQTILLQEINKISVMLKNHFKVDKINIATLGNVVSQLHIHVIGRNKNDISFPKPVWNFANPVNYSESESKEMIKKIKSYFEENFIQNNEIIKTDNDENNLSKFLKGAEKNKSLISENNSHLSDDEILRKKILYRSMHRGCKETDFLLGNFFSENINNLEQFGLQLCSDFITEDDLLIYDWILGKETPKAQYQSLIEAIRQFSNISS